jgi:hypothetical protein
LPAFYRVGVPQNLSSRRIGRNRVTPREDLFRTQQSQTRFQALNEVPSFLQPMPHVLMQSLQFRLKQLAPLFQ